ncbi:hypothetical protein OUZ56_012489 [Daphnia magna]|uniref:Uncharacterized protein n=1 Tax=Daphnia magna TaxID=35525 RepID=A0ABQ9Z3A7_9CRUS|nr:hypothetical protein OUZ56_012489 [Daphnia magna]
MKQTKRALGRLINEDQLQKLKNDYMLAMKSWAEKEMEKEIASMEAQEHIYELEKSIMTSELKIKQGIIDSQPSEMLKLQQEFAQKAIDVQKNDETLKVILNGLNSREAVRIIDVYSTLAPLATEGEDHAKKWGISIVYKLRQVHVYPNSFQEMNVKLMSQNPATMDAFRHTEATQGLVQLLNNSFDNMNGRHFGERIWSGNWQRHKKNLTDLLNALNDT